MRRGFALVLGGRRSASLVGVRADERDSYVRNSCSGWIRDCSRERAGAVGLRQQGKSQKKERDSTKGIPLWV